jgi:DNA-binding transcriptional LysR family regulator
MATALLPRHLEAFGREYPEIGIELLTTNRFYSLARNEADVAIRPWFSTDEDRIVPRRVCQTCFGLFASASYLSRFGTPRTRDELIKHRMIEWRGDLERNNISSGISSWFDNNRQYGSNSLLSIRALVTEGLGIALLPEFLGIDEPRLIRILPELRIDSGYLWVLHHGELRHFARIRAFNNFMFTSIQTDPKIVPVQRSEIYKLKPVQVKH